VIFCQPVTRKSGLHWNGFSWDLVLGIYTKTLASISSLFKMTDTLNEDIGTFMKLGRLWGEVQEMRQNLSKNN